MRRRKTTYPKAKTATASASQAATSAEARAAAAASRTVSINLQAMTGRPGIAKGTRVRIASGLYAGEIAVVDSIAGGVIPAVVVTTEAGRSRRLRTVDVVPVEPERPAEANRRPDADPDPTLEP